MRYEYLNDTDFLKRFDLLRVKNQTVRITLLDWQENPRTEITGKVQGGSINVDGSSSIRRTANLNILIDEDESDITNVDNLFSLNKKVLIEIGFRNDTNEYTQYETLWFPQGLFIIVQMSLSHGMNGTTLSMQLKDKMCLLNGEVGGVLPASVTFDVLERLDGDGNLIIEKVTIYQMIMEIVNHWGGEQLGKIIISDIDTKVKNVMKWIGDRDLYLYTDNQGQSTFTLEPREGEDPTAIYQYNMDCGYIYSDFYYNAGDLIGNAGAPLTEILDKIKNYLGNFEYFYDLDGNFVFQEIKNYTYTTQATNIIRQLSNKETELNYVIDQSKGKSVYKFDDSYLISSYSNNPQFNRIKNDYLVWGIRETATGAKLPIRYHLAIDKKPITGATHNLFIYTEEETGFIKAKPIMRVLELPAVGRQGIIYLIEDLKPVYADETQEESDLVYAIDERESQQSKKMKQVFTSKYGFLKYWDGTEYHEVESGKVMNISTTDWRCELYFQGVESELWVTDRNYYYTELVNEWPKQYNILEDKFYDEYQNDSTSLDYYLDFIDTSTAIGELGIDNIGRRTIVVNDDKINCIFERDIPNYILIEAGSPDIEERRAEAISRGIPYVQVDSNIYQNIALGGTLNSAYNRIREMLENNTQYNESITLQTIPIYYLEPNTRITVIDKKSNISGDYMMKSFSIPLDINGTMSISATKAVERL